ncbi:MAG TPA: cupredoxin domain-containing protein [Anaerolineae bacterium]|jgi:plastocyanin|nr:cupredoxin domain-containing protein [Anaerolineae bacterium]
MGRRLIIQVAVAVVLALMVVGIVSCAVRPGASEATIANLSFVPPELTVSQGATVTWTNKDNTAHTVTSDEGLFGSPVLNPSDKFEVKFENKGTFVYHCEVHDYMKHARVIVK